MAFDPAAYAAHKAGNPDKPRADLIGKGKHTVQVTDHEIGYTNSGLKLVNVTFEREDGARRKHKLITEGNAAPYQWWKLLEAVGWPMTEPLDEDDPAAVRDAVYDHRLQIDVQDERRDGQLTGYQEVKWLNRAPGGTGQPDRKARTPGERFGGASVPDRAPGGSYGSGGQFSDSDNPPPNDDDIPFSGATGI